MQDSLAGLDLGILSAAGLLGLAVLFIFRGWLIPGRLVDRERQREKEAHEREVKRLEDAYAHLLAAYDAERTRADVASQQVGVLADRFGTTMGAFTRAALPQRQDDDR